MRSSMFSSPSVRGWTGSFPAPDRSRRAPRKPTGRRRGDPPLPSAAGSRNRCPISSARAPRASRNASASGRNSRPERRMMRRTWRVAVTSANRYPSPSANQGTRLTRCLPAPGCRLARLPTSRIRFRSTSHPSALPASLRRAGQILLREEGAPIPVGKGHARHRALSGRSRARQGQDQGRPRSDIRFEGLAVGGSDQVFRLVEIRDVPGRST